MPSNSSRPLYPAVDVQAIAAGDESREDICTSCLTSGGEEIPGILIFPRECFQPEADIALR